MATSSSSSSSSSSTKTMRAVASWRTLADAASWYCAIVILAMILLGSIRESYHHAGADDGDDDATVIRSSGHNKQLLINNRPCDEIYVVGEGETLHTISDKCGDPYIVERNPHIHDPDDVFPGLVIRIITPSSTTPRKFLR